MKVSNGVLSHVTNEDIINGTFPFPEGVKWIDDSGFRACTCLQSIDIPRDVNRIGDWAFSGCTSLESIRFPEGLGCIGHAGFMSCTSLKSISFNDGFTATGWATFSGCTSLKSVHFPEGFMTIGDSGFARCTSLKNISFPATMHIIGEGAFSGCTSLESIRFLGGVNEICDNAFADCSSLSFIYLSSSKEEERLRVRELLPESLRSRIVSRALEQKLPDMLDKELRRTLQIPTSNAMRRSAKNVGFFPDDVFTEINKQTNPEDNAFCQKARREISKLVLPANEEDFKVYETQVKAVVDMVVERATKGIYSRIEGSSNSTSLKS